MNIHGKKVGLPSLYAESVSHGLEKHHCTRVAAK